MESKNQEKRERDMKKWRERESYDLVLCSYLYRVGGGLQIVL